MNEDLNQILIQIKNKQALLLDVREEDEWNQEHLPYAELLPLSELETDGVPELPNIPLYIHCKKGGRAIKAAEILSEHYSQVIPLKYSFEELKQVIN